MSIYDEIAKDLEENGKRIDEIIRKNEHVQIMYEMYKIQSEMTKVNRNLDALLEKYNEREEFYKQHVEIDFMKGDKRC